MLVSIRTLVARERPACGCDLFRRAQGEELFRGRSIEAMGAGSVYAACRCKQLPWTLEEVSAVSRVNKERVENAYLALNR